MLDFSNDGGSVGLRVAPPRPRSPSSSQNPVVGYHLSVRTISASFAAAVAREVRNPMGGGAMPHPVTAGEGAIEGGEAIPAADRPGPGAGIAPPAPSATAGTSSGPMTWSKVTAGVTDAAACASTTPSMASGATVPTARATRAAAASTAAAGAAAHVRDQEPAGAEPGEGGGSVSRMQQSTREGTHATTTSAVAGASSEEAESCDGRGAEASVLLRQRQRWRVWRPPLQLV